MLYQIITQQASNFYADNEYSDFHGITLDRKFNSRLLDGIIFYKKLKNIFLCSATLLFITVLIISLRRASLVRMQLIKVFKRDCYVTEFNTN